MTLIDRTGDEHAHVLILLFRRDQQPLRIVRVIVWQHHIGIGMIGHPHIEQLFHHLLFQPRIIFLTFQAPSYPDLSFVFGDFAPCDVPNGRRHVEDNDLCGRQQLRLRAVDQLERRGQFFRHFPQPEPVVNLAAACLTQSVPDCANIPELMNEDLVVFFNTALEQGSALAVYGLRLCGAVSNNLVGAQFLEKHGIMGRVAPFLQSDHELTQRLALMAYAALSKDIRKLE